MPAPTPSVLEIHPGIQLKGSFSAVNDVVLTGKFEGELQTLGCLTVAPGGAATGSIDAGSLVLEPGNLVEARIKIAPSPKSAFPQGDKGDAGSFWKTAVGRFKKAFSFGRK